ncbi:MAG: insulinase family protein [Bacteroidales bacterium]|nr:insulinase family protein [Bacteroidales bacterium]
MKKTNFLGLAAIAALALTGCKKEAAYQTVPNDPMQTRIYTLENGLKVYLSENHETPRVTAHIAVNTGHRNDPADCTGLAHYLEHLMFKGTQQFGTSDFAAEKVYLDQITALYEEYRVLTDDAARKAKYHEIDSVSQLAAQYFIPNEYDKLMATIGGNGTNAYTWYDITCYTEDVPANEIERWAEIQSDRFQNLVIRGFHTELETVYEEKNMSLTKDNRKVLDALMTKLHPSHSYGTQTTLGTQDHLKNPSIQAIYDYFNRYYRPNNVAICMAGDFNADEVIEVLKKHFSSWTPGEDISPRQFPEQPVFTTPQDTTVYGIEMEQLYLGWRFDGAASHQTDTLELLGSVLSNGRCGLIDLDINQRMTMLGAGADLLSLKDYSSLILVGVPTQGQTLEQCKDLLFAEVEKVKKGEFDDDLITSIINNEKRNYLSQLTNNRSRVSIMVDAFINGQTWADQVQKIERKSRISKADVVAFAQRHLTDGYAASWKRRGEDTSIKKIEKPAITPIQANRDLQSAFVGKIANEQVPDIQPRFVDYATDLTQGNIGQLPLLYVKNEQNDLFTLVFRYEFGDRADVRYASVGECFDYLGTSTMSNDDIKKEFYKLACDVRINTNNDNLNIVLSGLSENMDAALDLFHRILPDLQPDDNVYQTMVTNILKSRAEQKQNQETCMQYLTAYAQYGPQNDYTNILSEKELKSTDASVYTELCKTLLSLKHSVCYYGPKSVEELSASIAAHHPVAETLADVPQNRVFKQQLTPKNEVIIAPYQANNIYLRAYNNAGKPYDQSQNAVVTLFNEYFGGGMNGVVFQELRETRGLCYNAYARFSQPSDPNETQSYLEHIITQSDKMMECISTFRQITNEMPATPESFQIAKDNLKKNLASQRVNGFAIINNYLRDQRMGNTVPPAKVIYETLPSLELNDILRFEQENIAGQPMRYFILGDEKQLDLKALQQIAPIKRVSLEEIFGY